uniref:Uncharacterized protein n=1 Tax=Aegilops tauschii subsp. strangulata TaxID=200361 RepID=A0A453HWT9_AEGTS
MIMESIRRLHRALQNCTTMGNMKPWLELGIPDYKKYRRRFLTREDRFMDECNVNPWHT